MTKETFEDQELWISDGRGNRGMVWIERAAIETLTRHAGLAAVGVYATLASRAVGSSEVATSRPTNASLGADVGLSPRQIRRYIKTLDDLGFVARVRMKKGPSGGSQRPDGVLLVDDWRRPGRIQNVSVRAVDEPKEARIGLIRDLEAQGDSKAKLADKYDREISNSRTNMTASFPAHIKERAPAGASSDSINLKQEDLLRKSEQQAVRVPSPHRELMACLEAELHIEGKLYGYPRLAKETKALVDAGITPEWVRQFKAWYERDRWSKGFTTPLTSVAQIRAHWGQFRAWVKEGRPAPRAQTKPERFEPSVVAVEQATEAMVDRGITIEDFFFDTETER